MLKAYLARITENIEGDHYLLQGCAELIKFASYLLFWRGIANIVHQSANESAQVGLLTTINASTALASECVADLVRTFG
jgi:hypothetical protein